VALIALSVLLLISGVGIVLVLRAADRALADQTQRAFPARVAASRLLTSLVDQETGLRGYALTRDRRFLEPYRNGLVNEQESRARLERYVLPNDRARLALITLDAAVTAWRDQYASLRTADIQSGDADETIEFGRELFERVRQTSSALDAQLAEQVRAAQRRADDDRQLVLVVLAAMALALIAAVVALQRGLRVVVLRPLTHLAEQVATVSGGDHTKPIVPVGPPDIRDMGQGVESMRLELINALAEVEHQQRGLERRAAELARSNADLEQFAYVASHDLQEPLRKVASFCQLLEQRYSGQLDERGEQYIAFAVDGAKRMQRLISDLLTFSRVGRTSEGFAPVDLAAVARRAWHALDDRASEAGADVTIELDHVPQLMGDASLLQLLLSNLFGNALKYRQVDVPPRIQVTAAVEGTALRVNVADNGIGIPDEYADKVFVIFQRLHGRDEYEGTGIGLALAKKIVEFHGGTIGLAPSPLGGACVTFTLSLEQSPADG
jgi:signal transduction histidine kinase